MAVRLPQEHVACEPAATGRMGGAAGFGIPLGSRAKRGCASEKRGAPSYVHGPGAFPAVSASLPPDSEPGAAIPSRVRRAMHERLPEYGFCQRFTGIQVPKLAGYKCI